MRSRFPCPPTRRFDPHDRRTSGRPGYPAGKAKAKQFLTYVSSGPFQYAVAEALRLPDSYFHSLREDLLAKRELLAAGLAEAGFAVFRPSGTYLEEAATRLKGLKGLKTG